MARPGTPSRGPQSRGQLHVGRYFGVLALLLAALYAIVFLGGPGSALLKPRLGLDLQGGASVVLTPRTDSGKAPRADQLQTAVQIIQQRVNGLGVAEAEVVTQGSNIVVSVPGGTRDSLKSLSQTAQLRFREVLDTAAGDPNAKPPVTPTPAASAAPQATAKTSEAPAPAATTQVVPAPSAARKRVLPEGLITQATPAPQTAAAKAAAAKAAAVKAAAVKAAAVKAAAAKAAAAKAAAGATPAASPSAAAGPAVKSGDPYSPAAFAALDCSNKDARAGGSNDKPEQPIVSCSDDGAVKYHLDVAKVVGTDVKGATAALDQQTGSQWQIVVAFTGKGQDKFTNLTAATINKQVAIVLDGITLSAPTIQQRIDSDAQITGNFDQKSSQRLANTLKYGALPLSFDNSQVEVVSATLGKDQLHAGLIAGGLGLLAVVVYSILYYRVLGLVTVLGLSLSGLLLYAAVTVLGKQIGFALSLAGIAGFIVSVGITADSFVVYFERLKDEVREGRTPRSAADRAWVRARRTILSADTVSFLAAVILYFLSVGSVRGFAFTLGLSTVVDIAVVFLFTRPLVSFLTRFPWFTNPTVSGMAAPRNAPDPATAPRTPRVRRPVPDRLTDQEA
ncbi:MAG: protein-export rane protein SecD [Frankiales bacterium]|nr:protein-export rane protein SecD [Frankiales bacterium]